MANKSGTIRGSAASNGNYLYITWEETSYSVANNTSTVKATIYLSNSYGSYSQSGGEPWTLNIGGQSASGSISGAWSGSTVTVGTATKTITHDSNGTKSITISATFDTQGTSTGKVSASGTAVLTTIPRASSISANKTSVELGSSVTFTITRASSSFTHNIQCAVDGSSGFNWWTLNGSTKVDTSYTWTLPTSWARYFPSGQKLRIRVVTYSGSTEIGAKEMTALSVTAPSSMAPSATLSISDPTGVANTYGGYVKAQSKISVSATDTFQHDTSAKSRALVLNGVTYNAASATTPDVINTIPQTVSYTVTDGRGLSYSTSQTLTTYDWYTPAITGFTANRCTSNGTIDEEGAYCKVEFTYNIAPVNNRNTKSAVVKYKVRSASNYTSKSVTLSNYSGTVSTIIPTSTESMFDILLELTDAFTTSSTSTTLGTAYTLVDYHSSGKGIAFGKVAETTDLMDINLPVLVREDISFYLDTNTSSGTDHDLIQALTDLGWEDLI